MFLEICFLNGLAAPGLCTTPPHSTLSQNYSSALGEQLMRPVLPALALGLPGWTGNLQETKTSSWSECTFFQQSQVAVVTVSGWRPWRWWHCPSWVVFSGVTLAVLSGASFLRFLLVGQPDSPGFLSILLTTWWLSNNFFFFCLTESISGVRNQKPWLVQHLSPFKT